MLIPGVLKYSTMDQYYVMKAIYGSRSYSIIKTIRILNAKRHRLPMFLMFPKHVKISGYQTLLPRRDIYTPNAYTFELY